MTLTRINKYIASSSGYSRREVDALIASGRVSLNGEKVTEQGVKVDEENDVVFIDGEPLFVSDPEVFKFYKPRGILTAYGDGRGKDTLEKFSIFANRKIPYSGRLDYESEGLLIFTNDGELIQRMQRPDHKVEKEYTVTVDRMLTEGEMREFSKGLETSKATYDPCYIAYMSRKQYKIILKQGKKRQIRDMFAYFGVRVKRLVRIRIGPILLDDMRPGEHLKLTKNELRELKKCTGLK